MKVRCPNPECRQVHVIKDEYAGQRGKCPSCGTAMKIPPLKSGSSGANKLPPLPPSRPSDYPKPAPPPRATPKPAPPPPPLGRATPGSPLPLPQELDWTDEETPALQPFPTKVESFEKAEWVDVDQAKKRHYSAIALLFWFLAALGMAGVAAATFLDGPAPVSVSGNPVQEQVRVRLQSDFQRTLGDISLGLWGFAGVGGFLFLLAFLLAYFQKAIHVVSLLFAYIGFYAATALLGFMFGVYVVWSQVIARAEQQSGGQTLFTLGLFAWVGLISSASASGFSMLGLWSGHRSSAARMVCFLATLLPVGLAIAWPFVLGVGVR